jgi:hypothetical protein
MDGTTFDFARSDEAGDTIELQMAMTNVQEGRSFSAGAMTVLQTEMVQFVAGRVMHRWDATKEPPTMVRVTVTVEAVG